MTQRLEIGYTEAMPKARNSSTVPPHLKAYYVAPVWQEAGGARTIVGERLAGPLPSDSMSQLYYSNKRFRLASPEDIERLRAAAAQTQVKEVDFKLAYETLIASHPELVGPELEEAGAKKAT